MLFFRPKQKIIFYIIIYWVGINITYILLISYTIFQYYHCYGFESTSNIISSKR